MVGFIDVYLTTESLGSSHFFATQRRRCVLVPRPGMPVWLGSTQCTDRRRCSSDLLKLEQLHTQQHQGYTYSSCTIASIYKRSRKIILRGTICTAVVCMIDLFWSADRSICRSRNVAPTDELNDDANTGGGGVASKSSHYMYKEYILHRVYYCCCRRLAAIKNYRIFV